MVLAKLACKCPLPNKTKNDEMAFAKPGQPKDI
jgi:hypothetical protein